MKFIVLFSFLNIFFQSAWEEYVSLNGRFKILTPGPLVEQVDTVDTDLGTLAYHTFHFQKEQKRSSQEHIYMVSYVDYPEGIIFADSLDLVEEFFEETLSAAAESVDGEILYSTDIQLDANPGKFWRIDYLDGKAVIKTKAFVVGNRYYSIQVVTAKGQNLTNLTNQFLDSFELL